MKKYLKNIFSIRNDSYHKQIIILGIKLNIKRKTTVHEKILDELYTIKNLLTLTTKISSIKEATGVLKNIQQANYNILLEVDRVCRENNIIYWLNFGTLLGAVRHKDFIPWDDDIDIGMLRKDYDRFIEIFNKSTNNANYKAELYSHYNGVFNLLKIYDDRNRDCLFVDIFPYDSFYKKLSFEDKLKLTKELKDFHQSKNRIKYNEEDGIENHHKILRQQIEKEILNKYTKENIKNPTLFWGGEYYHYRWDIAFFEWNEIFPVKNIIFHGKNFPCPNQTTKILHLVYKDYMKFPDKIKFHSDFQTFNAKDIIDLEEIANENEKPLSGF